MMGMQPLFSFVAPPSRCGYLPEETWSLRYDMVKDLSASDYLACMLDGWRRFGCMLFRPQCPECNACQALRVDVSRFRPSRSQMRARRLNQDSVQLKIGAPSVTQAKLRLYDRFHAYQSVAKGWPEHPPKDAGAYRDSFVYNPQFTEEWCYFVDGNLAGVGYVDNLQTG